MGKTQTPKPLNYTLKRLAYETKEESRKKCCGWFPWRRGRLQDGFASKAWFRV